MTAHHVGRTWNKGKLLGAKSPARMCLGDPKLQLVGQGDLVMFDLAIDSNLKGTVKKKPDPASWLTEQTRGGGLSRSPTVPLGKKRPIYGAIYPRHAFSHP